MRRLLLVALVPAFAIVSAAALCAQEFPMPGPEHARLKAMEGDWEATISMPDGTTSKGEQHSKVECGGLWLATDFKGDFGELKFHGKGLDGYDAKKKKYVSVWVDSMSASPLSLEGTYDEATKTMTMAGEGPGAGGQPMKFKNVTKLISDDEHEFKMYEVKDGSETLMMTIQYKRKK